jgi:hypothetical protein
MPDRLPVESVIDITWSTQLYLDEPQPQYTTAVDTHKEGRRVRFVGTLKKVGRGYVLEKHSGIEVIADER